MTNEDPILEKIRAVMRLAEDPATPEKARENHMAHAHKMIAKYGVDQALLSAAATDPAEIVKLAFTVRAPYARDRSSMVWKVARAMKIPAIRVFAGGKSQDFHLFGTQANLDRFELLFRSLELQMVMSMAQTERTGYGPPPGTPKITWRKSFMEAYAKRVAWRIEYAEQLAAGEAQTASGTSAALVLKSESDRALAAYNRTYPTHTNVSRSTSTVGYAAGAAAGSRADIGGTRIGGSRRTISA